MLSVSITRSENANTATYHQAERNYPKWINDTEKRVEQQVAIAGKVYDVKVPTMMAVTAHAAMNAMQELLERENNSNDKAKDMITSIFLQGLQ